MKGRIKERYFLYKRRLADVLQRKTSMFSLQKKKFLLGLFICCFSSMSIYAIVGAFTKKQKTVVIQQPLTRIDREKEKPSLPFLSKAAFERIEKYKQQLLAMPKPALDSFMLARPKLLDSIEQIEQFYQSQK